MRSHAAAAGYRRSTFVAVLVTLLLAACPRTPVQAQAPTPLGWLDATVWQAQPDGSVLPLAGVTLLLNDAQGGQVTQVQTDANGAARIVAPPGAYSLIVYRDGYVAIGRLQCTASTWDPTGNVPWTDYSAIQESPLKLDLGRGLCRKYLFAALPPPVPLPAIADYPVHLTFDDGYVDLCETVDLVNQLGIHATFFLTGQAILANPDCVRQLVATGNQLGNHTFFHENLTTLSRDQILATLQATEDAAEAVAGVSTRPLCRPPYGASNAFVRQVAAAWGCQMILWDRDTRDWAGVAPGYIESQALSVSCTGEIVLMHTQAYPREVIALPAIVTQLEREGCEPTLLPTD